MPIALISIDFDNHLPFALFFVLNCGLKGLIFATYLSVGSSGSPVQTPAQGIDLHTRKDFQPLQPLQHAISETGD